MDALTPAEQYRRNAAANSIDVDPVPEEDPRDFVTGVDDEGNPVVHAPQIDVAH